MLTAQKNKMKRNILKKGIKDFLLFKHAQASFFFFYEKQIKMRGMKKNPTIIVIDDSNSQSTIGRLFFFVYIYEG